MMTTKRWSTFSWLRGYDFATDKLFWSGVALVFSRPWRQLFRGGGISRGHDEQWSTVWAKAATKRLSATVTAVGPKRILNERLVKLWFLE